MHPWGEHANVAIITLCGSRYVMFSESFGVLWAVNDETHLLCRYVLLGEACYPLQSWLMRAYPEKRGRRAGPSTLTEPQKLFNRGLSRALRVSEGALLRLRARWQCLSKRNDCGLDVVPTMILACCILHNVCESHGDAFKAEWQAEVAETESPQPSHKQPACAGLNQSHAEEVRQLFCDYFEQQNN